VLRCSDAHLDLRSPSELGLRVQPNACQA
jgi:hypothetical protein